MEGIKLQLECRNFALDRRNRETNDNDDVKVTRPDMLGSSKMDIEVSCAFFCCG